MKYIRYKSNQYGGISSPVDDNIINLIKMHYEKANYNAKNIDDYNFTELKIEKTYNEIKKIYDQYEIIVLRNPFKEYIFIGNNPTVINNVITVDIDLDKNPTIIAHFGDDNIIKFYKDAEFKFKGIFMDTSLNSQTLYKTFTEIFINDFSSFDLKNNKIAYNGFGIRGLEK